MYYHETQFFRMNNLTKPITVVDRDGFCNFTLIQTFIKPDILEPQLVQRGFTV